MTRRVYRFVENSNRELCRVAATLGGMWQDMCTDKGGFRRLTITASITHP
ncbi:hypothetical protein IDJ75_08195 [Mucilaginibacter rigui]|uniref:Uncharacterized protein n=1 Tax=Mucilaginibacter rigui TaxID=534635 RepID=A0ABR7X3T9_9SPHI|nr:hypothetical protein [Mucilaginibacter rigui]